MASADLARTGTSRLEEFAAFNDELAGLVRAGLPLELGLGSGGRRHLADRIADRLRQGRSLDAALQEEGDAVPAAYRAVVEAGLRSGRLADAVETVSRAARAMAALRRRLTLAAVYPAVLIVTSFVLMVLVLPKMLSVIVAMAADAGEPTPRLAEALLHVLRDDPGYWQFWLPVVAVLLLWRTGGLAAVALYLPGVRGLLCLHYRLTAFAELAAGLLEHGVPLDEAVTLAATASGDRALARDAAAAAARLRSGQPAAEALGAFESAPRFARWMMTTAAASGTLPATLRQIADWSSRRAAVRADWFALIAPLFVTLVVGGLAVGTFAAASFGPVIDLMYRLTAELSR